MVTVVHDRVWWGYRRVIPPIFKQQWCDTCCRAPLLKHKHNFPAVVTLSARDFVRQQRTRIFVPKSILWVSYCKPTPNSRKTTKMPRSKGKKGVIITILLFFFFFLPPMRWFLKMFVQFLLRAAACLFRLHDGRLNLIIFFKRRTRGDCL